MLAAALAVMVAGGSALRSDLRLGRGSIPVQASTSPATPVPPPSELQVRTSCGVTTIAQREYAGDGSVFAGDHFDVLLMSAPGAAQILVADPSESAQELRMTATRKIGPGRLHFRGLTSTGTSVRLTQWQRRTAPGWPPHWGLDTVLTGPGCWHLEVISSDATDVIVFELSESDWEQICGSAGRDCPPVTP